MSTRKAQNQNKPVPKSRLRLLTDPLDNLEAFDEFVNQARDEASDVIGELQRTGFFRPVTF